ncbi:MAG: hypothetical protein R3B89_20045 [Polyangiaceae bacterium]
MTREIAASRQRLVTGATETSGTRRWFARLHWLLVASVATTQLMAFSTGVGRFVQEDPRVVPVRRLAHPSQRATAEQAAPSEPCAGIHLGEVLLDSRGEPTFATLRGPGQSHAFPRRIGDRLAGAWKVRALRLSAGETGASAADPLRAQVELASGDRVCTLGTEHIRRGNYSASL